tara:strand:- start:1576 stop:2694 length:1119 start_codon:yes stop_codon:yes gene_type:complete
MTKIGLIGAGRLGICLGLLIEQVGYDVIASDVREDYVKGLQEKRIDTSEPDVQELLSKSSRIQFTTDNSRVIKESDIIFTLVQTPSLEDGSYDVSAVWKVVEDFQQIDGMLNGKSLVVGCTTNPGDCEEFQKRLEIGGVGVYYNPEFIAQGSIIKDLRNADMVLIGGYGHHIPVLEKIYYGIQGEPYPYIHNMSTKAAELTKIAVNCFLTTKVSYANQVGQVMIKDGMESEVDIVLNAIGSDSRIGTKYLGFGFGFGGPCFPRDNRAFAAYAQAVGVNHAIGETTDNFNNEHSNFLRDYYVNKNLEELPFCFKYLTYKAGIDILTESRPYDLALALLEEGYKVYCLDDTVRDQVDDRIIFETPNEKTCMVDL